MKFKLAALALLSVAMFCSESNADLLGRMLGRGGCGECQAAPTCCDTPAPCCGQTAGLNCKIGLPGRLFKGCDTGCDNECGGCGGGRVRGLFTSVLGGGCDCCECAAAPADTCEPTCGCDDQCGSGLLNRGRFAGGLLSQLANLGCNSGCDSCCDAPAPAPCAAAPSCECVDAPNCGCGRKLDLRGRVGGLFARVSSLGCGCQDAPECGCEAAPAPDCDDSSCDGGCRPGLLDRLRNMGGRCNAGCGGIFSNSGCGNCGCGTVTTDAPKDSAPVEDDAAPSKDPVVPVPVEEKGASNGISIDPSSFVFKG